MTNTNYLALANFYEQCLEKHGATPNGVDWPNQTDLQKRFDVMLEIFSHEKNKIDLLDLGCGYGALLEHLNNHHPKRPITYLGVDISSKMIQAARSLFPTHSFINQDILKNPLADESTDYIIMNGLLTEKRELPFDEMVAFAKNMIEKAYKAARKGIAFNVMNYHVDWCDPHLFYWSFDELSAFLIKQCSRHILIRSDYGLYEYTVYVYKNPRK